MFLNNSLWLWNNSAKIFEEKTATRQVVRRLKFMLAALAAYPALRPILSASKQTRLGRQLQERPEIVGAALWPYQCIGWNGSTRLKRIGEHYEILEHIGTPVDFEIDGEYELLDLSEIREGLKVVLDHSKWFLREGELVINLFVGSLRIYSLAFSFFHYEGTRAAFVGAIQGRDVDGIMDIYRELTKASHGMRPRDLLIEIFVSFCELLGIVDVFAVSDAYRHHRDAYFGCGVKSFSVNYDQIWTDRGAELAHPMYYKLKVENRHKKLDEIPAKKRGMYRRRYDMISSIKQRLSGDFCGTSTSRGLRTDE
jgi:uncharacterized protein